MEPERYDELDSSSEDGSSLDEPSWISWFCLLRHHELFCEVDPAYIQDRFNLNGLKEEIGPLYGEAMGMILGSAPTERQLADPSQRIHKTFPDTKPVKNSFKYVPRLFGFKLHAYFFCFKIHIL
ncbi:hypothetical protein T492DRAFT_846354 [Pavlovales sp. CCMP2436]|nr:hypothetical protein T492DRAFT_846354 [Pavlovales sp. CCMP2436]